MAVCAAQHIDPGMEDRPVLHLDGPTLTSNMEILARHAEHDGGVERYVDGLKFKAGLFDEALGKGRARHLNEETFKGLVAFMPSVRRRIGPRLKQAGFPAFRDALTALLDGAGDTTTADARMTAFRATFPDDGKHRWVRDLAAEVLHHTLPELYPMMCRWVWDVKTNTGVLREIWHDDNVEHLVIDIADNYAAFLMLREELSQFLTDNGVFRDVMHYVDLLQAQIYGHYVSSQGSTYLRADFSQEEDPMQYVRRLLGLDGIDTTTGRTRFKTVDGEAHLVADIKLLN
jgi:hypothetical protein